jgi:hypothetical protein
MKKTLLAFAAAASVATLATVATPDKANARVYVYEGARYCFYFDGWHGPGWYRCGYRLRTGLGWGGGYGWQGWRDAGWERRHGRHGGDIHMRGGERGHREGMRGGERGPREGMRGGEMRGTTGVNPNRGPSMRNNGGARGGGNINAAPGGSDGGTPGGASGGGAPQRGNSGNQ